MLVDKFKWNADEIIQKYCKLDVNRLVSGIMGLNICREKTFKNNNGIKHGKIEISKKI